MAEQGRQSKHLHKTPGEKDRDIKRAETKVTTNKLYQALRNGRGSVAFATERCFHMPLTLSGILCIECRGAMDSVCKPLGAADALKRPGSDWLCM